MGLFTRKPRLEPEAFLAYLQRLPDDIEVEWKREDDAIVGKVHFDNFSFATQAKSVKDFVYCVNEGVLIANNTPDEYLEALDGVVSYAPPTEELDALMRGDKGSFSTARNADAEQLVIA